MTPCHGVLVLKENNIMEQKEQKSYFYFVDLFQTELSQESF